MTLNYHEISTLIDDYGQAIRHAEAVLHTKSPQPDLRFYEAVKLVAAARKRLDSAITSAIMGQRSLR